MVLQFLDRILTMGMPSSRGEEWQPLLLYRNSLVHGETDLPPQTARRAYGRRRRDAGWQNDYLTIYLTPQYITITLLLYYIICAIKEGIFS